MKLKIFKNNNLVEVLEGADLVAILSAAFNDAIESDPFSYAYFSACQEDDSISSSDGDEFVLGLFKALKKVTDDGGYQLTFEPCLTVTTYEEMDLYLKHVHTYAKPELIDIKTVEAGIRARCLIDSVGNPLRNDLAVKVNQVVKDFLNESPMKVAIGEDDKDFITSLLDEDEIGRIVNDSTDLIINRLGKLYFTNYIKYAKENEDEE